MTPYHESDGVTLYHGDCREILPQLGRFDLLLTDPPYGLADKLQGGTWGKAFEGKYKDWDAEVPDAAIANAAECCGNQIIWGGNYCKMPPSRCWLVWYKRDAVQTMASCELAWTSYDANAKVFDWTIAATNAERVPHPTQKPLALMRWCLQFAPNAKTILDPFAGSGTTLLAAKLEGRKAVGIEISEEYCEIAANRLRQRLLF